MKKLFIVICALFVGFAYAANETVVTSKKFVDAALAQKQPKFDGLGNDKLMLYSNTTDGIVASRDIVTTLGTSTSADTVPTVGAINAGLNTKQDILNGDAGWVAENTGIAGAVVQKPVYSATNNYSNALVEVETLNNAVINAVNSELTVVPGVGWTINTANNLNLLPTPQTYNDVPPGGYTHLEYIESTGTQYIDTDTLLNASSKFEFKFMTDAQRNYAVFGASNGSAYDRGEISLFYYQYSNGHSVIEAVRPNDNTHSEVVLPRPGITADTAYTVSYDKNELVVNGASQPSNWYTGYVGNRPAYLFATNRGAASWIGGNTKIYYFKIYNNNELVRNFIPARRNTDNTLGMYDTVSGTFFTNAGTGTFTAGSDVNSN